MRLNKALLDTDTYSEILKRKNPDVASKAAIYIAEHGYFTLSCLTVFEIVWGLQRMGRIERVEQLLNELPGIEIIEVSTEVAVLAGRIFGDLHRTGQQTGSIDALIAATALHHKLTLATGNTRHFERIQRLGYPLILENWKLLE